MKIFAKSDLKATLLTELLLVVGGVLLLFGASQIEIPLKPVPITLQTVAVMLIGLTYSPRRALESHLVWLGLVAAGFPLLAGFSGGLHLLVGPTAGYMFGFVVASFLMATLKQRLALNSWQSDVVLTFVGTFIVFGFGVLWLSYLIGWPEAFYCGVLPFVLPGLVKGALLCTLLHIVRHKSQG